jgi:ABC-2 type transport system ATP-binding protein
VARADGGRARRCLHRHEFTSLPGVTEIEVDGSRVSFKAFGDLDAVVKAAARHTVKNLEVAEPTPEEIFLTFYGRNGTS